MSWFACWLVCVLLWAARISCATTVVEVSLLPQLPAHPTSPVAIRPNPAGQPLVVPYEGAPLDLTAPTSDSIAPDPTTSHSTAPPPFRIALRSFAGMPWAQSLDELPPELARSLRFTFLHFQSDINYPQIYLDRCHKALQVARYSCLKKEEPQRRMPRAEDVNYLLLVEYRFPGVVFHVADTDAVFDELSIQYCSVYHGAAEVERFYTGSSDDPRPDLGICGFRLKFSATSSLPGATTQVDNNNERVRNALDHAFGLPVPVPEPDASSKREQRRLKVLAHEIWCPVKKHQDFNLDCVAQLAYVYDLKTRNGLVFMGIQGEYAYEYSRLRDYEQTRQTDSTDLYYRLMLADPPIQYRQTTTYIGPEHEPTMDIEESLRALLEGRPGGSARGLKKLLPRRQVPVLQPWP